MRILLVEDDIMIADALLVALRDASYAVDHVMDGQLAHAALRSETYQMILLDLGLPLQDGLTLLKNWRANSGETPVIIMTARDDVQSRIQGLDLGADDYVVKPFEVPELLARIRAVTRRQSGSAQPLLSNGKLTLNPANHEASYCDATNPPQTARLSGREYALLHALLSRKGTILSRSDLETSVYGWGEEVESNAIEFVIHNVRKKLGPKSITNVRGVGWMVEKHA
ncbi:response regulator [Aquirhabdus sp.]|uniref:response regulator n=1 Tax=Aquirhabdus sp. TaxID=2824160 RepID=UPI00396C6FA6